MSILGGNMYISGANMDIQNITLKYSNLFTTNLTHFPLMVKEWHLRYDRYIIRRMASTLILMTSFIYKVHT